MKKTINNLLIVFVSLIILLTSIHYLEFILRPTDTDGCISAIKAFHELPTTSIDVIGYGSSLMWKSLNTKYIYDKYKINAYNYGNNWQNINTTLLFIEDSLRSQSPKLVIIETSRMNKLLIDLDVNGQVYYTKEIKNFDVKKEYLKQVFNKDQKKYIAYYFPIYNLHENWKNINKDSFIMNDKKQ